MPNKGFRQTTMLLRGISSQALHTSFQVHPICTDAKERDWKSIHPVPMSAGLKCSMLSTFLNVSRLSEVYICAFLIQLCPTAMFFRRVLDKILTMPDLAGISKNRTKPAVGTRRQPQASDESSPPPQRTKGKVKQSIGAVNRLIHSHR